MLLTVAGTLLWAGAGGAQTLVRFPATQPFATHAVQLRAELHRPPGTGPFPAVLLMHGCAGWQPAVLDALRGHAHFFRDSGFVVLNLDSFSPRGISGPAVCMQEAALRQARWYRTFDAFDALRYLRALAFVSANDVFLVGQSNGGTVALRAASVALPGGASGFKAVVAYYPWCGELDVPGVMLRSPLLVFAAGQDGWVSAAQCLRVRVTGAPLSVHVYPGALHSFDLDIPPQLYLGRWVGGNHAATDDSRLRMRDFFRRHLTHASGPTVTPRGSTPGAVPARRRAANTPACRARTLPPAAPDRGCDPRGRPGAMAARGSE